MISIIIPTYNCSNYLIKTLDALAKQTYKDFEVIVVDDGSTDDTQYVLSQYLKLGTPYKIEVLKQEHKGSNAARNLGFKHSSGEYLLFLDADKELVPYALERFVEVLKANPHKAYAYCNFKRDNVETSIGNFDAEKLSEGELLIDLCALIRREAFPREGFDTRVKRLQDWDLWLTLLERDLTGILIPEVLFVTVSRPGDITSTESLEKADRYIREKHKQKFGILKGLVDIIILRFNTPEYDKECLTSIIDNTEYPYYQLTVFDNYYPRFTLSKIWNMLIKKSFGEYICLLNNDTKVTRGWLKKLIEVFKKEDNVGAVGPSTNECHTPQKINIKEVPKDYEVIDFYEEFGKEQQLSGFCLVFPKKVWEEVGGFDERFGHYGQECEFLHRLQERGYKTLWRKDVYVWHVGEASGKKLEKEEGFDIKRERQKGNELYRKAIRGEL